MPALADFLVAKIGDLLVVHAPRIAAQIFVGVVANGVALHRIRLERQRRVEFFQPVRSAGREHRMRKEALASDSGADAAGGLIVYLVARCGHLLVGQKPIAGNIRGRTRNQSDLGVAVEEHFFDIIGELEILDRLLAAQFFVPAELFDGAAHFEEVRIARVVTQKMRVHVDHELIFHTVGSLLRHCWRRGFRRCASKTPP